MKAEIISVSNDLLNGRVSDQNAAYLLREFAGLGIKVSRSVFVEDAQKTLIEAIERAEQDADLVVLIGGLGPDANDITKQTLSKHLDIPLVLDQISEDKIITYHKNSNIPMPANNQLQASVIQDATPIRNVTGLATGMFFEAKDNHYLLFPGPFDEFKPTYEEKVAPLIKENFFKNTQIETRILRVFGLSDTELNLKLADFVNYDECSFVGIYPVGEEFEIRIVAKADSKQESGEEADALKKAIVQEIKPYIYSEKSESLLKTVKDLLSQNEWTVTAAESLTGGQFLSAFSSQEEASAVLSGGMVTYSTEVKNNVLGVPKAITDKYGVVSAECAISMAEKAGEMFEADIAVSLTGVAGPSSLEGEIPGTVWIGITKKGTQAFAKKYHFAYRRNKNRSLAVFSALDLVRKVILEEEIEDKVTLDESEL